MFKNTPDPWSKIPLNMFKNTPDPWSKIPMNMFKNTPDPWSKIPLIHGQKYPQIPQIHGQKIPLILMFVNIHIVLEPQMSWNWKRILLIVGRCDEQPSFAGDLLIQKNTTESEYFSTQNTPQSGVFLDPKIPLRKNTLRGIFGSAQR